MKKELKAVNNKLIIQKSQILFQDTYHVNCPFSNDIFRFMPVPTGIWKARGLLFSDNVTVLCIDFDSRVVERRV